MSTLAVTNTFLSGTVITASSHNQNNLDIVTWANGNIGEDNFDTLAGLVSWNVSTTVGAIAITHTGTGSAPLIEFTSTTKGTRVAPVMTSTQRDALTTSTGLVAYNSTDKRLDVYNGAWHSVSSVKKHSAKTADYTATYSDDVIECDATGGAITITLPAAATIKGKILEIKKTDTSTNAVTVDGNSSETIDGATTLALPASNDAVVIQSDGTNWKIRRLQKSPTQQVFTSSSGTYTTPTGVKYLRVRMCGSGGSGASSGSASAADGSDGNVSTFGSSLLTANGGSKGLKGNSGAASGGSATIASPAYGTAIAGGKGGSGGLIGTTAALTLPGGPGGTNAFGGGAVSGTTGSSAGIANTGAGGSGGSFGTGGSFTGDTGGGGGAGGYLDAIIPSPSSTYAYAVGASVNGASAGTNGQAGGNSGSGYIEVTEHYQ